MNTSETNFRVTFFGVRGVHPCDGPTYEFFGGRSICTYACLTKSPETLPIHIVFDAGSGVIPLGDVLVKQEPQKVFLFFSHVHLDHMLGLPFFAPVWSPHWEIHIFCGYLQKFGGTENYFKKHISPPLFPVPFSKFPARLFFHDLNPGDPVMTDDFSIQTFPLNHPGGALGYRLNYQGRSLCHVTDTEHTPGTLDLNILNAIHQADLVIYDSTYTDDTWAPKQGWGHSTWEEGIRLAKAAEVKNLALYHHDPAHTDAILKQIDKEAKRHMPQAFVSRQDTHFYL